jgi:hypothetical protein
MAGAWNPVVDGNVYDIDSDSLYLFVGGEFGAIGGLPRVGLARFFRDAVPPPGAQLVTPDGGEHLVIGTPTTITWNVNMAATGMPYVDVYLSRSGSSGPWELVAGGAPSTGSCDWTPTGPQVIGGAFVRIEAHDGHGQVATDVSAAPFDLIDPSLLGTAPPLAKAELALAAPSPNPIRASGRIEWTLPRESNARLSVLDVQGREVARLADGVQSPGRHSVDLDARALRAGVYFLRLQAGGERLTRRFAVVR